MQLSQLAAAAQDGTPIGCCHFCGCELAADERRTVARYPEPKIMCRKCKRVDQAIGRAYGSVQFVRDLPFDKSREFYRRASSMAPKQIAAMCAHTLSFEDCRSSGPGWFRV